MAMEWAYLGRDNTIDLSLLSNGSAVDLSGTTQINLRLGSHVITSTGAGGSTASISWAGVGYATGEVRLHLGGLSTLTAGRYDAYLAAFDGSTPLGVVWGRIGIELKADPMST